MQEILHIINQIGSTSSRAEKENILKTNSDNQLLKDILYFTFNNYIVTGISKKKISKKIKLNEGYNIYDTYDFLNYLKENNTGKDIDIYSIQNFIKSQPEELKDLYTKIATKDLVIGVTATTLDKIYGNDFIPLFSVMLAEKYFDNENKVKGEFILTTKLDGLRCTIVKENGNIKLFSRQGQLIQGLVDIEQEAVKLQDNHIYDGELILRNDNGLHSADLFRETQKVVRKDGIKKNVEFNVFDMLSLSGFQKGIDKTPCSFRKATLKNEIEKNNLIWIKEVPILYQGTDKEQIMYWLNRITQSGGEGVMLNIADAPYSCKRTSDILKVKRMQTMDLEIVGFEEGDGKYTNTLGRINVDFKGVTVGVGSGYSDEDRKFIWKNRDSLLGRIVEVQYFEISKNSKAGLESLRFPVFKHIREIGKEVSFY